MGRSPSRCHPEEGIRAFSWTAAADGDRRRRQRGLLGHWHTTPYEKTLELIGKAWALPAESTQLQLDIIQAEKEEAVEDLDEARSSENVLVNATGMETLKNIWGLFETAVQLNSAKERLTLYDLARELEETQNLLDWIEKTPAEQKMLEMV